MPRRHDLIQKYLIEYGLCQPRNDHAESDQTDEDHRRRILFQLIRDRTKHIVARSLGAKCRARADLQRNPRKGRAELLPRHGAPPDAGIVEIGNTALNPLKHEKVIELPVNDERVLCVLNRCGRHLHALCLAPAPTRRTQHAARIRAVAVHPALGAELFERHPLPIVRQNHRK